MLYHYQWKNVSENERNGTLLEYFTGKTFDDL